MDDKRARDALRDKVQQERRAAVGVPTARDDTTLEIVRDGQPADAERLWDKPRRDAGVGAWIAVSVVFAATVAAAFILGFAALYAYETMR